MTTHDSVTLLENEHNVLTRDNMRTLFKKDFYFNTNLALRMRNDLSGINMYMVARPDSLQLINYKS